MSDPNHASDQCPHGCGMVFDSLTSFMEHPCVTGRSDMTTPPRPEPLTEEELKTLEDREYTIDEAAAREIRYLRAENEALKSDDVKAAPYRHLACTSTIDVLKARLAEREKAADDYASVMGESFRRAEKAEARLALAEAVCKTAEMFKSEPKEWEIKTPKQAHLQKHALLDEALSKWREAK